MTNFPADADIEAWLRRAFRENPVLCTVAICIAALFALTLVWGTGYDLGSWLARRP